jgi:hypothetical protein
MAIPEVLLNHNWDGYVCVKASALADLLASLPGYSHTSFPAELREQVDGLFDEHGDKILRRGTGREDTVTQAPHG